MMDFSTLKGLTIAQGEVYQIADGAGRVLWAAVRNAPVVLTVEKITSDTKAGETVYTGEQFILLDIYPKTNGTVKVTYGGLTKTITDTSGVANPNALQVFFGTFNGVADSVATPDRGELRIEGEFNAFAVGTYSYNPTVKTYEYCSCITSVVEWGKVTTIPEYAFYGCSNLDLTSLPSGITSIGDHAFYFKSVPKMEGITLVLPSTLESIGASAFVAGYKAYSSGYPSYIRECIMLSDVPPKVDTNSFGTTCDPWLYYDSELAENDPLMFTVPKGSLEAYETDEVWGSCAYKPKEAT